MDKGKKIVVKSPGLYFELDLGDGEGGQGEDQKDQRDQGERQDQPQQKNQKRGQNPDSGQQQGSGEGQEGQGEGDQEREGQEGPGGGRGSSSKSKGSKGGGEEDGEPGEGDQEGEGSGGSPNPSGDKRGKGGEPSSEKEGGDGGGEEEGGEEGEGSGEREGEKQGQGKQQGGEGSKGGQQQGKQTFDPTDAIKPYKASTAFDMDPRAEDEGEGPQGPHGPHGPQGPQGPHGPQGPKKPGESRDGDSPGKDKGEDDDGVFKVKVDPKKVLPNFNRSEKDNEESGDEDREIQDPVGVFNPNIEVSQSKGSRSWQDAERKVQKKFVIPSGDFNVVVYDFGHYKVGGNISSTVSNRLEMVLKEVLRPFVKKPTYRLDPSVPLPTKAVSRSDKADDGSTLDLPRMAFGTISQFKGFSFREFVVFVDVSGSMDIEQIQLGLASFYRALTRLGLSTSTVRAYTLYHATNLALAVYTGKPSAVANAVASGAKDKSILEATGQTNASESALTSKFELVLNAFRGGRSLITKAMPFFWFSDFYWSVSRSSGTFNKFLENKVSVLFLTHDNKDIEEVMANLELSGGENEEGLLGYLGTTICRILMGSMYGIVLDPLLRSKVMFMTPPLMEVVDRTKFSSFSVKKSRCYRKR